MSNERAVLVSFRFWQLPGTDTADQIECVG